MLLGVVLGISAPVLPIAAGPPRPSYEKVDAAMRTRLRGVGGGGVLVVHDHAKLHERVFGHFRAATVIPIASASKWLTAATVMSLVEAGRLALDDPVSRYLPQFGGAKAAITIRELLDHRSGLDDAGCVGDPAVTLAACVDLIASTPAPHPADRVFHYSGTGYEVIGRVIEVASGEPFERAFEDRIATPIGLTSTRFDRYEGPSNPDPAASATSSLQDYARFVDVMAHLGASGPRSVLSAASVAEIERDQETGVSTRDDAAVQITHIPTYGLGVWRDVTDAQDTALVISGSGALGFYPWIDRVHDNYGIVAVDDERGSTTAVPASQRVARLAWTTAAAATPPATAGP